jgi:hypothetical protein
MTTGASSSAAMMPTGPPLNATDRLDVRLPLGTHLCGAKRSRSAWRKHYQARCDSTTRMDAFTGQLGHFRTAHDHQHTECAAPACLLEQGLLEQELLCKRARRGAAERTWQTGC